MIFNPLFFNNPAKDGETFSLKLHKASGSNYLFADIIKIYNTDLLAPQQVLSVSQDYTEKFLAVNNLNSGNAVLGLFNAKVDHAILSSIFSGMFPELQNLFTKDMSFIQTAVNIKKEGNNLLCQGVVQQNSLNELLKNLINKISGNNLIDNNSSMAILDGIQGILKSLEQGKSISIKLANSQCSIQINCIPGESPSTDIRDNNYAFQTDLVIDGRFIDDNIEHIVSSILKTDNDLNQEDNIDNRHSVKQSISDLLNTTSGNSNTELINNSKKTVTIPVFVKSEVDNIFSNQSLSDNLQNFNNSINNEDYNVKSNLPVGEDNAVQSLSGIKLINSNIDPQTLNNRITLSSEGFVVSLEYKKSLFNSSGNDLKILQTNQPENKTIEPGKNNSQQNFFQMDTDNQEKESIKEAIKTTIAFSKNTATVDNSLSKEFILSVPKETKSESITLLNTPINKKEEVLLNKEIKQIKQSKVISENTQKGDGLKKESLQSVVKEIKSNEKLLNNNSDSGKEEIPIKKEIKQIIQPKIISENTKSIYNLNKELKQTISKETKNQGSILVNNSSGEKEEIPTIKEIKQIISTKVVSQNTKAEIGVKYFSQPTKDQKDLNNVNTGKGKPDNITNSKISSTLGKESIENKSSETSKLSIEKVKLPNHFSVNSDDALFSKVEGKTVNSVLNNSSKVDLKRETIKTKEFVDLPPKLKRNDVKPEVSFKQDVSQQLKLEKPNINSDSELKNDKFNSSSKEIRSNEKILNQVKNSSNKSTELETEKNDQENINIKKKTVNVKEMTNLEPEKKKDDSDSIRINLKNQNRSDDKVKSMEQNKESNYEQSNKKSVSSEGIQKNELPEEETLNKEEGNSVKVNKGLNLKFAGLSTEKIPEEKLTEKNNNVKPEINPEEKESGNKVANEKELKVEEKVSDNKHSQKNEKLFAGKNEIITDKSFTSYTQVEKEPNDKNSIKQDVIKNNADLNQAEKNAFSSQDNPEDNQQNLSQTGKKINHENINFTKEISSLTKTANADSANNLENTKAVKYADIIKEISKFIIGKERNSITFNIEPENLGKLKVTLDMMENNAKVNIQVENEVIKKLVENNVTNLFQNLNQNGLTLSYLQVSTSSQDQKQNKSGHSKKKFDMEKEILNEEQEKSKIKNLGYNTYEFLV